jgi:rhamnogalacturonan endolyase
MRLKNIIIVLAFLTCSIYAFGQTAVVLTQAKLISSDDFSGDTRQWYAEFEQPMSSSIKTAGHRMDVDAGAGATVWFKKKLSGNIIITYSVIIVDAGGKNDRVSDLNAFWMASNPGRDSVLGLDGKFTSYDHLKLYYAGIGGHDNTTSRFRKYEGNDKKDILKEYIDKAHLLSENHEYFIKIIVKNGMTQYFLDNILYWEYDDKSPYTEGYFGFRTTRSHQIFNNFQVFQIEK